jgi:filamentous hemagglutinin
VKNDPNLLTMSSQLVGLVAAAAVDGDIEKGAWVAQNATQYNYLTHAQEAEKDRELEGCKEDKFCRVEKATKWALIDAQQDLGILVGVGGGIGLSAAETAQGVFELVQHLPETVEALKQLASSPEFRQQFTDSYFSDLEQRAARLTQAYNDAGWQGSVTAGVEGARFAVELVGVLTAVRGTAQVAAKLPDAAKQVVNAIAEAPAAGGWKAQLGAAGDVGKVEFPSAPNGAAIPKGFANADDFARFGSDTRNSLAKAGYGNVEPILQGSAVTGKSFKTGQAFDVGRVSDFDIALADPELLRRAQELGVGLRSGGTRTGPLSARDLQVLGLKELAGKLSEQAGREVNFMIYDSAITAASRAPSMVLPR